MRRTLFEQLRRFRLAVAVLAMHGLLVQAVFLGAAISASLGSPPDELGIICRGDAAPVDAGRIPSPLGHGCQCPALCPHHGCVAVWLGGNLGELAPRLRLDASPVANRIIGLVAAPKSRDGKARAPPVIGPRSS